MPHKKPRTWEEKIDRLLTGKWSAYPLLLGLLLMVLWLTVSAANVPSQFLSDLFFRLQEGLNNWLRGMDVPEGWCSFLVDGVYRVVAWVVAVMLPPMAIFFPMFTLMEDIGLLPRIAYDLDLPFQRCHACGKQALTMSMGFGCNAAGVVGARIIDSPRERLLAILTNAFVPCNGKFPTLIALLTMFFVGVNAGFLSSVGAALGLLGTLLLSVGVTFGMTAILSRTLLKGVPSFFTLELPPYRMPQVGKVIVHAVTDRILFVLGRAISVAAPAGAILWVLANTSMGGESLLLRCADFLDPVGRWMGMDGAILLAFLLGFPANEIVLPILLMIYLSQGYLVGMEDLTQLKLLLEANGWTWLTGACVLLFSLLHWPCSTTLWTIRKETGSWKWTALAALLPTAVGVVACAGLAAVVRIFS